MDQKKRLLELEKATLEVLLEGPKVRYLFSLILEGLAGSEEPLARQSFAPNLKEEQRSLNLQTLSSRVLVE